MTRTQRPLRFAFIVSILGLGFSTQPGCIIAGSVGDDPGSSDTEGDADAGSISATGSIDQSPTTGGMATEGPMTTDGSHSGTTLVTTAVTMTGMATAGPLDPESALDFCGVIYEEAPPEGPAYEEIIFCDGGCIIELTVAAPINLYKNYGDCLCAAMDCGPLVGGGGTGPAPDTDTGPDTVGDTTESGEPDECGLPPGEDNHLCECETCGIELYDVDSAEVAGFGLCECVCANAGCGLPV